MCGISGIINFNKRKVSKKEIRIMMQNMKHRGPDDEGIYIDSNVGLGFVRLSILDLSYAGHQPMHSHDNRYIIVYNGEVYNYLEIRDQLSTEFNFVSGTDTEVVLAAFQKWGKDCVNKFNGMFSFLIFDKKTKNIFASRDRFGIKPFYYYLDEERFIFASEIKSILPLLNQKEINYNMVFDYVAYNRTDHTSETFFKGIFKLNHGCNLAIKKNKLSINRWYNIYDKISSNRIPVNYNQYLNILEDSIKLRLRSDVDIGVSLSGGIDSSAITSILINKFKLPELNSFSSVYNSNKSYDEYSFIKLYSNQLKKMHYTYPSKDTFFTDYKDFIYSQSEPVNDVGSYIQYKVMSLVGNHVKVVLDGQGADEQLGGYHNFFGSYYKELLYKGNILKLLNEIYFYINNHSSIESLKYFIYYLIPDRIKSIKNPFTLGSINKDFFDSYSKDSIIPQNLYNPKDLQTSLIQHFEHKLEHLLKWDDLNSMRFSVESRLPFLDYRLVETSINLPSNLIINKGTTKSILRNSIRGIVPNQIVNRKDKKGFSNPRSEWFRSDIFRILIMDILNSNDFNNLNIFDVKDAKRKYNLHFNNKGDYSIDIWKWINLYEWNKQFIKK